MNIRIQEIRPSNALTPYIQSYWTGEFNINKVPDFTQTVVPNGCIELIIHMTGEHCFLTKNKDGWNKSPVFTLLGMYPKTYDVKFSNTVKVFGMRIFPDGIRNIFNVAPVEFLSTFEDGMDVLGKKFRDLCSRIRESERLEKQVELAENYLLRQLSRNCRSFDYTHIAMQLIRQSSGVADYQQITDQVPISSRQLQREFKKRYGITVRDYIRISRMNAIYKYMLSNKGNLTELAHELHFTDQSHFIKEYRNFIGLPPGEFVKDQSGFIVNAI